MVKKGYGALIIGANSSCSNLNFFKKGDYPYKLCNGDSHALLMKIVYFCPFKRKLY